MTWKLIRMLWNFFVNILIFECNFMNKHEEFHENLSLISKGATRWGIFSHRIREYVVQGRCQAFEHRMTREMTRTSQKRSERERKRHCFAFLFLHFYIIYSPFYTYSSSQTILFPLIFFSKTPTLATLAKPTKVFNHFQILKLASKKNIIVVIAYISVFLFSLTYLEFFC